MGMWYINATIDDEYQLSTVQHFEVKEYTLPRFEIILETKSNVHKDEVDILLTVYGNYTFGEFVTGTAK